MIFPPVWTPLSTKNLIIMMLGGLVLLTFLLPLFSLVIKQNDKDLQIWREQNAAADKLWCDVFRKASEERRLEPQMEYEFLKKCNRSAP